MFTRLLVPLDGSNVAEGVLPYVRFLASRLELPVELLAAVDVQEMAAHLAMRGAAHLDAMVGAASSARSEYLETVARSLAPLHVLCHVDKGLPAETIVARAATDSGLLIAMATHGRSGIKRWLMGSVTEKVLRGTVNPLLLVHGPPDAAGAAAGAGALIVPLDGSAVGEEVLPLACHTAKRLDLRIQLVRVCEVSASMYSSSGDILPDYAELRARIREDAESYLREQCARLDAMGLAKVGHELLEGDPAHEIIEHARGLPGAMLAMCTHGRSGVRRWAVGSVTEKIVRHGACPVLVVSSATRIDALKTANPVELERDLGAAMRYTLD